MFMDTVALFGVLEGVFGPLNIVKGANVAQGRRSDALLATLRNLRSKSKHSSSLQVQKWTPPRVHHWTSWMATIMTISEGNRTPLNRTLRWLSLSAGDD